MPRLTQLEVREHFFYKTRWPEKAAAGTLLVSLNDDQLKLWAKAVKHKQLTQTVTVVKPENLYSMLQL